MFKSRLSVACLFFVTTVAIGAPHGILPGDMNPKGEACRDFFDYANGNWRAQNAIPDYMDRWSRRWQSGEVNKEHVRDILVGLSARSDWPKGSAEQLVGDYYAACMDEAAIDAAGLKPAQPMLDAVRAIHDRAGIAHEIYALAALGTAAPVAVYSTQDLHDPNLVVAQIDAGGLGLPDRDYYLKTEPRFVEARAKYLEHVQRMFELAGLAPAAAKAKAARIFAFEKRLAESMLDNVALRDPVQQDHKMSFADLQNLTPSFDWGGYFAANGLPRDDVNVTQPAFLKRFDEQISDAPVARWRDYLEWIVLNNAADRLSKPFVEQNFAFYNKYLSGATTMKPRQIRCAQGADGQIGEALGKAYVDKYFPPEAKARMQDMVKNILLAMDDTIRGLEWMSEATKAKAQEKLASFAPKIGYPDKWKQYRGMSISRASYWDNATAAQRWSVADNRGEIGKPVDRSKWGMTPPTSNANYNPSLNEIVFP
ncbi:MAG: M13 family metallopeptidase, partial [Arenimonas sp.]